ncbi:MAG TPA: hypothetical protein VGK22_07175 [Candidatus Angelobacter sp.]|jgi:hypothetical protein
MTRTHLCFIALIVSANCASAIATNATAANTEDQLRKSYINTEKILRHAYASDALKFDGNGNPKNHDQEGAWTVLSGVIIDDLRLKPGKVEFRGHRRLIVFDDQNKKMRSLKLRETFSIEIQAGDGPDQEARLSAALAQVFVAPEELASVVPDYWRDYIARATGRPAQGAPCEDSTVREVESGSRPSAWQILTILQNITIRAILLKNLVHTYYASQYQAFVLLCNSAHTSSYGSVE